MTDFQKPFAGKTFLIFHFRVGRTDGVSLEIAVWKNILETLGAKVLQCAGPGSPGADWQVKYFDYLDNPESYTVNEWAYGRDSTAFKNNQDFENQFHRLQQSLQVNFEKVIVKAQPDWIIVSNVFSLGENLPAVAALAASLQKSRSKTLLIHHDFYWEHDRSNSPINDFVKNILADLLPPRYSFFEHCCINTTAQQELYKRRGIRSMILTDSIDFSAPIQDKGAKCERLLADKGIKPNDLVILQATRIVPRKAIEVAVDFVKALSQPKNILTLNQRGLYNGRGFNPQTDRIVLLLAGYNEKQDSNYLKNLSAYVKRAKINAVFLNGATQGFTPLARSPDDSPTLLDLYVYSSLVTYPSIYEGFGNQFLEAIASRTPIAMFEYPVFTTDIKPKGFRIISFGNKTLQVGSSGLNKIPSAVMDNAVRESIDILTNPTLYNQTVEQNFKIGQLYYSTEKIAEIFKWIFSDTWLRRKFGIHRQGKQLPVIAKYSKTTFPSSGV